jgi:hypothetical protein
MGARGDGPGEFGFGLSLGVTPGGRAAVFDITNVRFVWFDTTGSPLDVRAGQVGADVPQGFLGGHLHLAGEALVAPVARRDTSPGTLLVRRTTGSTVQLAMLPRPAGRDVTLNSCGMSLSGIPPMFSPTLEWAAFGDTTAVADHPNYSIRVMEVDSVIRVIRRRIDPPPATFEDALVEIGDGLRMRTPTETRVCDPVETVEKRGFEPVRPAIGRIRYDPQGRLWVERGHHRGGRAPIDVFAADGSYVGTLPAVTPFPAAFLSGDRLAAIETDALDVARVVVYEIREP